MNFPARFFPSLFSCHRPSSTLIPSSDRHQLNCSMVDGYIKIWINPDYKAAIISTVAAAPGDGRGYLVTAPRSWFSTAWPAAPSTYSIQFNSIADQFQLANFPPGQHRGSNVAPSWLLQTTAIHALPSSPLGLIDGPRPLLESLARSHKDPFLAICHQNTNYFRFPLNCIDLFAVGGVSWRQGQWNVVCIEWGPENFQ